MVMRLLKCSRSRLLLVAKSVCSGVCVFGYEAHRVQGVVFWALNSHGLGEAWIVNFTSTTIHSPLFLIPPSHTLLFHLFYQRLLVLLFYLPSFLLSFRNRFHIFLRGVASRPVPHSSRVLATRNHTEALPPRPALRMRCATREPHFCDLSCGAVPLSNRCCVRHFRVMSPDRVCCGMRAGGGTGE
jgi:hypothetical protein